MAKKILLIQAVDNILGAAALVPGLQRDLEHSMSRSNSTEGSKMGSYTQIGSLSETISASFMFKQGDEGQAELRRAMKKGLEVKIWIVNTEKNAEDKYDATFGFAVMGELSFTYPYEGVEEISTELAIQIESQEGQFTTLPPGLEDFAAYGFELPGASTGDHINRTTTPTVPDTP